MPPIVELTKSAESSALRGHPWIYAGGIATHLKAESGTVVEVRTGRGDFLGYGLWDSNSPIAIRIYSRERNQLPSVDYFCSRIGAAFDMRRAWFDDALTNAYRICNGEGDWIPGVVLDKYDRVAVLRLDSDAILAWLPRLSGDLFRTLHSRGIDSLVFRTAPESKDKKRYELLEGAPPEDRSFVREENRLLEVDLAFGQKTGAFLDQRENRTRVLHMAKGRNRVLNLFSYSGGFSVAAALGGASQVVSVDIAAGAHASAQRSFRKNGLSLEGHTFVTSDVAAFLSQAQKRGDMFDLIISDPPSYAPSEKAKPKALSAYRNLHKAAVGLLAQGGKLCAASCSSHVSMDDFIGTLGEATLGTALRITDIFEQPKDHPTLPSWFEGRYLKFVVLEQPARP